MRLTRAILLGVLLASCAGCHWLLPLGGGPGGPASGDGPRRDVRMLPRREGLRDLLPCAEGCGCPFRSCKDLKDRCSTATSGLYRLLIGGRSVEVYCDMTFLGGGWLLVGRSASAGVDAGAQDPRFGWWQERGLVDHDSAPYSLGAGDALSFTEMLVGDRAEGKAWGEHVYRFRVPADFVWAYAFRAYDLNPGLSVERGDCNPGPRIPFQWMLRYAGWTKRDSNFFFRDGPITDQWGLQHDGFNLAAPLDTDACARWGHLAGRQGMIFVR